MIRYGILKARGKLPPECPQFSRYEPALLGSSRHDGILRDLPSFKVLEYPMHIYVVFSEG